jgi:hypothetical protein
MARERVFHGTDGDNILSIIASGEMRPGADHRLFFSRYDWAPVLQYGADRKRKAAFAVEVELELAASASVQRTSTPGVLNTFVVLTTSAVPARVLELFVREPGASRVARIPGADAISQYLTSRQGPAGAADVE